LTGAKFRVLFEEAISTFLINNSAAPPSNCLWVPTVFFLCLVTLCAGSTNLYPSDRQSLATALDISDTPMEVMLTGGVIMSFFALPPGVFLDKFGPDATLWGAASVLVIIYIVLPFCYKTPPAYIVLYLIMALMGETLLVVGEQIALDRSPSSVKGISCSLVAACMSASFGVYLEIYKVGISSAAFGCTGANCTISGVRLVGVVIAIVLAICVPSSYLLYRRFPKSDTNEGEKVAAWWLIKDWQLWILLFATFLTVFDGLLVINSGVRIWTNYGRGYPDGAATWGTAFSLINAITSVLFSILIDWAIHKFEAARKRLFCYFWFGFGVVPFVVAVLFETTDSSVAFGILISLMGLPFGFGLAQIPPILTECFGTEHYGFAYGISQLGSILAAVVTLFVQRLDGLGILLIFIAAGVLHIVTGLLIWFCVDVLPEEEEDLSTLRSSSARTSAEEETPRSTVDDVGYCSDDEAM
jgi:MFS family permease